MHFDLCTNSRNTGTIFKNVLAAWPHKSVPKPGVSSGSKPKAIGETAGCILQHTESVVRAEMKERPSHKEKWRPLPVRGATLNRAV